MRSTVLFTNALIIDGSGSPPFLGMVAVEGDTIIYVGPHKHSIRSAHSIDLGGSFLVPGFIDMHGHSDLHVVRHPSMEEKIRQGITTEVVGNCGMGVYPLSSDPEKRSMLATLAKDILGELLEPWPWTDMASYGAQLRCRTHVVPLQAHAPLRICAMDGNPNRQATETEIDTMVNLLERSYEQGAVGFSSGLYYAPCAFASRGELLALLKMTAKWDKLFAVHHRCEGDGVLASLQEVLELAREANVRIEVSHLKAIGKRNQQYVPQMLSLLESYANDGLEVGFDQYPYTFGSTSLYSLLPPQYLRLERGQLLTALQNRDERERIRRLILNAEGWDSIISLCGWDAISVMHIDGKEELHGKTFSDLAKHLHKDPFDVLFDLLSEGPSTAVMADVTQSEASLQAIMRHPLGCFGTDALYSGTVSHPRSYGSTTHLFSRYYKESPNLPIEAMVARMTSESARRLHLLDRGNIAVGYKADLVVLDMASLDKGSGFPIVMVNGEPVVNFRND
jgi:N-acyl-D-aspartate/D-glutamate deacylase